MSASMAVSVSVSHFFEESFEERTQIQFLSRLAVRHEWNGPVSGCIVRPTDNLQRVVALLALRASLTLRTFDGFALAASLAALAEHLPSLVVAGDAGIVMLRDVRSAFKLDDVELRIGFIRIEEAAHGWRDRINAMPRNENPTEPRPGSCAVSSRAWKSEPLWLTISAW